MSDESKQTAPQKAPPRRWRYVSSERAQSGLGYLTAVVDGRAVVDVYGADPAEKDSEELFRAIAARLDSHEALLAACKAALEVVRLYSATGEYTACHEKPVGALLEAAIAAAETGN